MSLKMIIGPCGAGKTSYALREMIKSSMKNPDKKYIVLVPEQFTLQTQKDIVMMHPRKGIMNIDVLSFGRLAYRVFAELGVEKTVLDDEGKNLILRRVIEDCREDLRILGGNLKQQGYISEIKSVLSEFTQYGIGSEDLERMIVTVGEGGRLGYKLADLKLLYEKFYGYIERRYITREEILMELQKHVGESLFLEESTVIIDGFTGFTPVQREVIGELLLKCENVSVTVTMDEREKPYTYTHACQMFALGKHTIKTLKNTALERGVKVCEPEFLYEKIPVRFQNNREMAFLEHNLFRAGGKTYTPATEKIALFIANRPREEAEMIAEEIRRLVRTEGYRYRDIGVVMGSMDEYREDLHAAFSLYDIPCFLDEKRNILQNPYVESMRRLLQIAIDNFSRESVFGLLRTGTTNLSHGDIDVLENYVLKRGIRGRKTWETVWRDTDGSLEEKLNLTREKVVSLLMKSGIILEGGKKSVREITEALYHFIDCEEYQLRLERKREAFENTGEMVLAREYAQIYKAVITLFEKLVALLGDEKVTTEDYLKILDAGLCEVKIGVIPPGMDQVVTGDLERTRIGNIKALFFLGANDVHIPGALLRHGLLSERDREAFEGESLTLAPSGKERAFVQKYYLYLHLTKPGDRLYISYSRVSSEGKSLRPSYLIQEVKTLFPHITSLWSAQEDRHREYTEKSGMKELIGGLSRGAQHGEDRWRELYSWYFRREDWQDRLERIREAAFWRYRGEKIDSSLAGQLFGAQETLSISRTEKFFSCAFLHYLTYGIRLLEREEYEFRPADMGNICHRALEYFGEKVKESRKKWTEISDDEQREFIREGLTRALEAQESDIHQSSRRESYRVCMMERMLRRTVWGITRQLEAGDFLPEEYEYDFRGGKIDRIDVWRSDDRIYLKIVDYKTGKKTFDITKLYYGLQIQMILYMSRAVRQYRHDNPEKKIIPAGVLYSLIHDPIVDRRDTTGDIEDDLLEVLRPEGIVNRDREILTHMDRTGRKSSRVIPVRFKTGGDPMEGHSVAETREWEVMMNYAEEKVEEARGRILAGDITVHPLKDGDKAVCEYCAYSAVCGFDRSIPGYAYRDMEKISKEEALRQMKEGKETHGNELD